MELKRVIPGRKRPPYADT